jgi:predicted transcriptional regulator
MNVYSKGRPARFRKERIKAGTRKLDVNTRRDMKQIILSALMCIHEQSARGTLGRDLQHRCELNFYYLKQLINYLLEDQLITKVDPVDDSEYEYVTYYLTQKGYETYAKMRKEFEAMGITPKINGPRERPREDQAEPLPEN